MSFNEDQINVIKEMESKFSPMGKNDSQPSKQIRFIVNQNHPQL